MKIRCEKCRQKYEVDESYWGCKIACPCGCVIDVKKEYFEQAMDAGSQIESADDNHGPESDCSKPAEQDTKWYQQRELLHTELIILGCIAVLTGAGIFAITSNFRVALIFGVVGLGFILHKIIFNMLIKIYNLFHKAIATDTVTRGKFIILNAICLLSMAIPLGILAVSLQMMPLFVKIVVGIVLLAVISGLFFAGIKLFPKLKPDNNTKNEFERIQNEFPLLKKKATNPFAVISVYFVYVKKYIKESLQGYFVLGLAISLLLSTLGAIYLQGIIWDKEAERIKHELLFGEQHPSRNMIVHSIVSIELWYLKYAFYYNSRDLDSDGKETRYFHDMAVIYLTEKILEVAPEYGEYDKKTKKEKVKPEIFRLVLKKLGSAYYIYE